MYKIFTIAFKDMLRSFRSFFALGMMFAAPLLITGLIYFAFSGQTSGSQSTEMQTLKVGIIDLAEPVMTSSGSADDSLALDRLVINYLKDPAMPGWMQVEEVAAGGSEAEIDLKTYGMVIVIPANFNKALVTSGSKASLDLYYDPALTIQPQVVKAILTSFTDGLSGTTIALDVLDQQLSGRGVGVDASSRQKVVAKFVEWSTRVQKSLQSGDPAVSHLKISSPKADDPAEEKAAAAATPAGVNILGLVMAGQVIYFAFYTGAFSCMSILNEQEHGTLGRLFTTPTARTAILAGKFTAVFLTVIVQAVVLMLLSGLIFQINWGSSLMVLLALLGLVPAAAGLGVFLISLVKNERQAGAVLGGALTFAGMLGGLFTVGVPNMPEAFQTINLFLPQGWALRAFRVLMTPSMGVGDMLVPLAVLLACGVVLFALGARMFGRRFS